MKMAVAVETYQHPDRRSDYKVWFLEINRFHEVVGIGVMTREEMVKNIFREYQKSGNSNWRAFCKDAETSKSIEVFDFIAQNTFENTHFGNLPRLHEFQETLNQLHLNLEFRAVAS